MTDQDSPPKYVFDEDSETDRLILNPEWLRQRADDLTFRG